MAMPTIERHPDIVGLRMRYETAAESPVAQLVSGLGFMAGVYLTISPWVLGFADLPALTANNLITGIAVTLLSLGFASAFGRTHGITWVVPFIGAWTIVAPWLVQGDVDTATTITNNVIVGSVCLLLGLGAMAVGLRRSLG